MNALPVPPSRLAQLTEGLPRPFWALLAGTFIQRTGTFIMPLLFVYLTQERRLPLPLAGTITSLYGAGALLGATAGGALADRVGRRATMLGSLLLAVVFLLLLGSARALPAIAAAVFFLGFAADAFRPASQALATDLIAPEHRLKAFAMQYWVLNLGFACAAIIGGYMAKRDFSALFLGEALALLVLAAVVWKAIPETHHAAPRAPTTSGSLLTPYLDRRYAPFLVLNLALAVVFFFHLSALPDDMNAKGLSTEDYGLAIAANGVLIVLVQPFVTRFVSRRHPANVLALAAALTGVGFGLNDRAASTGGFVACVAIWTLAEIMLAPVNATLVAGLSPPQLRGRYQGAFTLTWSAAAMLAPIFSTQLIPRVGHSGVWHLSLAVGLVVALAHLTVSARTLPKTMAAPPEEQGAVRA